MSVLSDLIASMATAPVRPEDVDACLHELAILYGDSGEKGTAEHAASILSEVAALWDFPVDQASIHKEALWITRQAEREAAPELKRDKSAIALTYFAKTTERKPDWIWKNHILRGATHVLGGKQGSSKGLATVDLAARWSRGDANPDGSGGGTPMRVLFVTREDSPEMALMPRLRVAGANMDHVAWTHGDFADGTPIHSMEVGCAAIENTVKKHGFDVVIIDPLGAWVEDDANNGQQIRAVIDPMNRMARRLNCAVLFVAHIRKAEAEDPMDAFAGSAQVTAAVRVAMLISRVNDGAERQFLVAKTNFKAPASPLIYRLASSGSMDEDDPPVLIWRGATAEDLAAEASAKHGGSALVPGASVLPHLPADQQPMDDVVRLAWRAVQAQIPSASAQGVRDAILSLIRHGAAYEGRTARGGRTVGTAPPVAADVEAARVDAYWAAHPDDAIRDVADACGCSKRLAHERKPRPPPTDPQP